ncbi:MAG: hypothetical protein ASARMPRED_003362 [Alectoria sarmentosa]|nr:MAG: hypothetical protein ASARMPRED_003362 [Alectoria sarmentosa]
MSPRRSSRARTSQPTPSAPQHTNSSSSSISSGRADRSARPQNKLASPRSSVAARSQSSEDREAPARPQSRRTRSSQDDPKDQVPPAIDDENDDEAEEEVTRCICGNQEYPGLPDLDTAKIVSKDESDPASFAEDTTGWFIQCDVCKVWQHGGCIGIMDEATSPEEYFCEQCRKDLHKITTTIKGRNYSHYLPMRDSQSLQSSPAPAAKEKSKKSRDGRKSQANADNTSKGRRSTMNSRDAAYEEEQLRRAIEESKREGGAPGTITSKRKGKRSRSESEERNESAKRQRTTSGSASSASQSKKRRRDADSEDEIEKPEKSRNIRGAAARNQRNKEFRDREAQREKERTDALGGRKGRAERRRGDDSDPSPQPLSRTVSVRGASTTNALFAAPALPDHPPPKTVQKKTGRPPAKRGRVGRNQYTKDRDVPADGPITTISPARSNNSHDAETGPPHLNGSGTGNGFAHINGFGKPSKPRHMNFNRTSMNDMKRRVAGILEFISHTQVEMTGVGSHSTTNPSTSTHNPPDSNGNDHRNGRGGKGSKNDADSGKVVTAALADLDGINEQAFAALSSVAMMEVLTRRLMKWQAEYGKWGEK